MDLGIIISKSFFLGGSMKDIKIYVMAHKEFDAPEDKIYVPLHVGAALHKSLGYLMDNTGENISERNPNYSELTGLYWMWKNAPQCDIMGLCHYRRYFLNKDRELLCASEYEEILKNYDVIVTEQLIYPEDENVYGGYAEKHYAKDLDLTRNAIEKYYPEYLPTYDAVINGRTMYYANMMAASQELMNQYAEWLFTILFDVEKNIDMTGYDDYNRRVFGFIAERLVMVWIRHNRLKQYETHVGLIGVKSETREMIAKTAGMLLEGNYKAVIECLDEVNTKRPDLFFKDSDTEGELANIYTFAEIMSAEEKAGKNNLLSYSTDYKKLKKLYICLGEMITGNLEDDTLYKFIGEKNLSTEFVLLSIQKYIDDDREQRIRVYNYLANSYLNDVNIHQARIYVEMALREE